MYDMPQQTWSNVMGGMGQQGGPQAGGQSGGLFSMLGNVYNKIQEKGLQSAGAGDPRMSGLGYQTPREIDHMGMLGNLMNMGMVQQQPQRQPMQAGYMHPTLMALLGG